MATCGWQGMACSSSTERRSTGFTDTVCSRRGFKDPVRDYARGAAPLLATFSGNRIALSVYDQREYAAGHRPRLPSVIAALLWLDEGRGGECAQETEGRRCRGSCREFPIIVACVARWGRV